MTQEVAKAFEEQSKINFMLAKDKSIEVDGYSGFVFTAKSGRPLMPNGVNSVLYNIVDRIFIGRMDNGELAMAGVGVAFPILMLISAFSALIGMGGAPLCAIKMGEKNNDEAEKIMSNSFSMLLIIAVILTTGFLIFKEPILWAFGASEATIGYALDYLSIYVLGTIFVQIALGMNSYINTQGFAKIGMMTVVIGAVINIVLDPIFIFVFDLGVKGAALATVAGQMVSALWVLKFLFGKKSILKIRKKYMVPDLKVVGSTMALGVSPFIMQSTESLVLISLNTRLSMFGGDIAVGAMTIMSSIMQIILMPLQGLAQGAQPIVSYNYGAKDGEKMLVFYKLSNRTSIIIGIIFALLCFVFGREIISVFTSDKELINISYIAVNINNLAYLFIGKNLTTTMYYQAIEIPKYSNMICAMRSILILPIVLVIMAKAFGENGIWISMAISEFMIILISKKIFNINKCTENAVTNLAS